MLMFKGSRKAFHVPGANVAARLRLLYPDLLEFILTQDFLHRYRRLSGSERAR